MGAGMTLSGCFMGVTLQTVETSGHQGTQDWQRMQGPHSSPTLITKGSVDWLPSIHASVPPLRYPIFKICWPFLAHEALVLQENLLLCPTWEMGPDEFKQISPIPFLWPATNSWVGTWPELIQWGWISRALLSNHSLTVWEWRGKQPRLCLEAIIWAVGEASFDFSQSCSW